MVSSNKISSTVSSDKALHKPVQVWWPRVNWGLIDGQLHQEIRLAQMRWTREDFVWLLPGWEKPARVPVDNHLYLRVDPALTKNFIHISYVHNGRIWPKQEITLSAQNALKGKLYTQFLNTPFQVSPIGSNFDLNIDPAFLHNLENSAHGLRLDREFKAPTKAGSYLEVEHINFTTGEIKLKRPIGFNSFYSLSGTSCLSNALNAELLPTVVGIKGSKLNALVDPETKAIKAINVALQWPEPFFQTAYSYVRPS